MIVDTYPASQAATPRADIDPIAPRHATCPLCHTTNASLSDEALAAGEGWRCPRCGQQWDAHRLATVAAYAAWVLDRVPEVRIRSESYPQQNA
jgi:hypothetical protein